MQSWWSDPKLLNVSVFGCIYIIQNKFHNALAVRSGLVYFLCLCLIWKVCVCKISGGLTMVDWHKWVTETESRSEKSPCGWNLALQLWWHHLVAPVPSVWTSWTFILFLSLSLSFPPAPTFLSIPRSVNLFCAIMHMAVRGLGGNRAISVRRSRPSVCVLKYILTQNLREAVLRPLDRQCSAGERQRGV